LVAYWASGFDENAEIVVGEYNSKISSNKLSRHRRKCPGQGMQITSHGAVEEGLGIAAWAVNW